MTAGQHGPSAGPDILKVDFLHGQNFSFEIWRNKSEKISLKVT